MTRGSRRSRLRQAAWACGLAGVGMLAAVACYSTGDGTAPPPLRLYFPVGLAVSQGGSTLYVVNSDFDLQYNAGTVQSYRLTQMRQDAVKLVLDHVLPDDHDVEAGKLPDAACPYTFPNGPVSIPDPNNSTGYYGGPGELPIGQACAPPVRSSLYTDNEVYIGAFATDIQMSITKDRLFIPVRGNASLTWVDVDNDTTDGAAPQTLRCTNSLDSNKQFCTTTAGNDSNEQGNTRVLTLPGEPFGMAQTDDGTAIALTHQNQTETSLLLSGIPLGSPAPVSRSQLGSYPPPPASPRLDPSLQFIVGNMPTGGVGLASIPHDPAATPGIGVRPAFLQTSSAVPEVDLLRYYSDEAYQPYLDAGADVVFQPVPVDDAGVRVGSSNLRPFLQKEAAYSVGVNSSGANSRGIAIDPTPRIVCEQTLLQGDPTITPSDPRYIACAQLPARVFIANRSPPTLILGQIGGFPNGNPSYDPDYFSIYGNVPLTAGPSNVYLAPVVDGSGHYALRVFVVCFDSQVIVVWDPDAQRVENVIRTGPGPFAMAFDPFDLMQVAMHAAVPFDPNSPEPLQGGALDGQPALRSYRFGYIASFTDSFLQVLDLDQSFQDKRLQGVPTFETIVYQVGEPTVPKGSQ